MRWVTAWLVLGAPVAAVAGQDGDLQVNAGVQVGLLPLVAGVATVSSDDLHVAVEGGFGGSFVATSAHLRVGANLVVREGERVEVRVQPMVGARRVRLSRSFEQTLDVLGTLAGVEERPERRADLVSATSAIEVVSWSSPRVGLFGRATFGAAMNADETVPELALAAGVMF
jgi:hypothetical protein